VTVKISENRSTFGEDTNKSMAPSTVLFSD